MARKGETLSGSVDSNNAAPGVREVVYRASDGLKLFARDFGSPVSPWLPVVCLPGLTRNSRDFESLGQRLAADSDRPRRVVAFDYRGRGRSAWDEQPENYNPLTEMNDVFDGMVALGIPRAIVVGTSRGGIIGMLMGVARPGTVAALVLNDVGPVIEAEGLARIKTYVGRTPEPSDWNDAAYLMRRLHGRNFPAWQQAEWDHFARLTYREEDGKPVGNYDPKLGLTFEGVELDQPIPALWDEFRALATVPMLVIRGEHSDLLSAATVDAMRAAHPGLQSIVVSGEGHPPLLRDLQLLTRVSAFMASVEGSGPPAEAVIPQAEATFNLDDASDSANTD